jgi:hypothetical protein
MNRSLRETIGRIVGPDWTMGTAIGLDKPVAEVFCNVTGCFR